MTRGELYELVWQTPLTKLAKRFGLSDVGLRKICHKHGIPTPPLGCWAKRAHGKPVQQPPLPQEESGRSVPIQLAFRSVAEPPAEVVAEREAALAGEQAYSSDYIALETRASKQERADQIYFAFRRVFGEADLPPGNAREVS